MEYEVIKINKILIVDDETAWGENYLGDENIIMVYISKIRDKIEDNPKKPKYLKTIRGLVYRFEKTI